MNTRNGYIRVYEDIDRDVVPPFLVAEAAGSLAIDADREQLKAFAESILDRVARFERLDGARVYRLPGC